MRVALAVLVVCAAAATAAAQDHTIPVSVQRVYDGDTLTVRATIWPGISAVSSVRVNGIDTPEIRGLCLAEREQAIKARDFVRELVRNARVAIVNPTHGRWAGRVVADVLVNGEPLGHRLIAAGLARSYDGGTRRSWCDNAEAE